MLAVLSVALTAGVLGTRALLVHSGAATAEEATESPTPAAVLAAWDAERAEAWATGDTEALADLYVPGSRAGRADVRLLGAYLERGVTVRGLQTQVLALDVQAAGEHHLDLVVTDRLVGGEAVGEGEPRALPRDRPSTRRITMQRVDGRWLVDVVRDHPSTDQPRAAASTSVTSSSRKS